MRQYVIGLAALVALATASSVAAQTKPINPTIVEFNPVPSEYGSIVRAEIAYFISGATEPVQGAVSLGKPPLTATGCTAPAVDPCARVSINTQPVPFGFDYVAKVRVIALQGAAEVASEWSDPSNPFDRRPGKPGGAVIR